MKRLLTISAGIEVSAGIVLAIAPSFAVWVLLGAPLDSPVGLIVGQVLGAALFALGAACWLGRAEVPGRAAMGLIVALMVYNLAIVLLMLDARIRLGISGVALWPAVILHSTLLVWCVRCHRKMA